MEITEMTKQKKLLLKSLLKEYKQSLKQNDSPQNYKSALSIIKKYFSKGQEPGKKSWHGKSGYILSPKNNIIRIRCKSKQAVSQYQQNIKRFKQELDNSNISYNENFSIDEWTFRF